METDDAHSLALMPTARLHVRVDVDEADNLAVRLNRSPIRSKVSPAVFTQIRI